MADGLGNTLRPVPKAIFSLRLVFKFGIDKKKKHILSDVLFMAEQEGFEPSVPFWGTHDFQSCPL